MSTISSPEVPAHLCGRALRGLVHACAFVDSREQQYRMLLPYLREGLAANAQLATMVASAHLRDHLDRMRRDGLDPEFLKESGKLVISTSEERFPRDGSVTPSTVLFRLEARIDEAQRAGFRGIRAVAEMDGALAELRRTEELLEYEARVNFVALKSASPIVCVYDLGNLNGSLVIDILRTHPKVILDGVLHENPYFVSPQEYLKHLVERRRRHMRVRERRAFALRI